MFLLEVELYYKVNKNDTDQPYEGEARAILDEQNLTLMPSFGDPIPFGYVEIEEIFEHDYKIDILTASKEKLVLEKLGYQYEDFLFQFFKLRNELLLKYLLMEESLIQDQFYGKFTRTNSDNSNTNGSCEIRLYDTALVVLPQKAEPIRLPYSYISKINKGDYTLSVRSDYEEEFSFSMLGDKFDPFVKALSDAYAKMMKRTQDRIKELIPEANTMTLSRLATLMKDGKAAQRGKIEQLSPNFWGRLIKRISDAGLSDQYDFLSSLTPKDQICVGVKQGLMGDLTGEYTWLLFPLNIAQSNRLSNTVALEAFIAQDNTQETKLQQIKTAEEPEDQNQQANDQSQTPSTVGATYFFRMMSRKEYAQTKDEDLVRQLDGFINNINKCMIDINFRREPIFFTETQLENPKYVQYRYAVSKISALKILRGLFVGRVIHTSTEQWKKDVNSLLTFNNKSLDDSEKWKKGDT